MIPTLPGGGDIPAGPERTEPTEIPRPTHGGHRLDELEEFQRAIRDLRVQLEDLRARVARLEATVEPTVIGR